MKKMLNIFCHVPSLIYVEKYNLSFQSFYEEEDCDWGSLAYTSKIQSMKLRITNGSLLPTLFTEGCAFLRCSIAQLEKSPFRKKTLPSSSGYKSKPSKKPTIVKRQVDVFFLFLCLGYVSIMKMENSSETVDILQIPPHYNSS
jgi:hypothetical protein